MKKSAHFFLALLLYSIKLSAQNYPGFHPIRTGIYTVDGKLYQGQLVGFENDTLYLYLSLSPFPVDSFTSSVIFVDVDDLDRMKVEGHQPPAFFSTMFIGGLLGWAVGIPYHIRHGGGSLPTPGNHIVGSMCGAIAGSILIREKINQEFRIGPFTEIKPFIKSWKRYIKNARAAFDQVKEVAVPYDSVPPNTGNQRSVTFSSETKDLPARKRALHIPRIHLRYAWIPYGYADVLQRTGISAEMNFWKYWRVGVQSWNGRYYFMDYPNISNLYVEEYYSGDFRDFQLGISFTPRPVNRLFKNRLIPRLGTGFLLRKYDGYQSRSIYRYLPGTNIYENEYTSKAYRAWTPGFYAQIGFDYLFSRQFGLAVDFIYKSDRGILKSNPSTTPFNGDTPFTKRQRLTSFLPFVAFYLRLF